MTVEGLIEALQGADFDLQIEDLLDAFWLALQSRVLRVHPSESPRVDSDVRDDAHPPLGTGASEAPSWSERNEEGTVRVDGAAPSRTPVYGSGAVTSADRTIKASPVSLPAGRALTGRLAMARALRPFRQRWPSAHDTELDEEATANAAADLGGHSHPVVRPVQERWYSVDVVLEDDPGITLWEDTMREFSHMLRETGAFRDVRLWRLRLPSPSPPTSVSRPLLQSNTGATLPTHALEGRSIRRLVFFATHGASRHWVNGNYERTIRPWLSQCSVVLLQLRAEHQWKRTTLGEPAGLCRALEPGAPISELSVDPLWWMEGDVDPGHGRAWVPIVALEGRAIARWASMQMARGVWSNACRLDRGADGDIASESGGEVPSDFQRLATALRESAPQAFRLAVALSPSAFTIPVARVVQEARFGQSADQTDLAEVLLSGLVFARAAGSAGPGATYYDFYPGAREILLRSLRSADASRIALALQARVSAHIERIHGRSLTFRALVPDDRGRYDLPVWAQPFAQLGMALLGLSSGTSEQRGQKRRLHGARILWVDNQHNNNIRERTEFERLGAEVVLASDTDDALQLMTERRFDVVISDLERTGDRQAGLTLLRHVRERSASVPFVFFAGPRARIEREELVGSGAFGATDRSSELFELIVQAFELRPTPPPFTPPNDVPYEGPTHAEAPRSRTVRELHLDIREAPPSVMIRVESDHVVKSTDASVKTEPSVFSFPEASRFQRLHTGDAGRRLYDALVAHPDISRAMAEAQALPRDQVCRVIVRAEGDYERLPWEALETSAGERLFRDRGWLLHRQPRTTGTAGAGRALGTPLRLMVISGLQSDAGPEALEAIRAALDQQPFPWDTRLLLNHDVTLLPGDFWQETLRQFRFLSSHPAEVLAQIADWQPDILQILCDDDSREGLVLASRGDRLTGGRPSLVLPLSHLMDVFRGRALPFLLGVTSSTVDFSRASAVASAVVGPRRCLSPPELAPFTRAIYRGMTDLLNGAASNKGDTVIDWSVLMRHVRHNLDEADNSDLWSVPVLYAIRPSTRLVLRHAASAQADVPGNATSAADADGAAHAPVPLPQWDVTFDEEGTVTGGSLGDFSALRRGDITDLFVFVHGWNVEPSQARDAFRPLLTELQRMWQTGPMQDDQRAGAVFVYWPSTSIGGGSGQDESDGVFGSLLNAGMTSLRALSYWKMRTRAQVIGETGLGPLLGSLASSVPRTRVHLVAHSMGARVGGFASVHPFFRGGTHTPIKSFTLLQGMLAGQAFAPQSGAGPEERGALADVVHCVDGPIVITHSRHDKAAEHIYRVITSVTSGDSDAPGVPASERSALGHDGARGVAANDVVLRPVGEAYSFGHGFYNVDASSAISEHSDIAAPEVAWLICAAARSRGRRTMEAM